jgi:3-hydroxyisobutyrate dehydrogenase
MAERVGFIGLGIMGLPMARNILKAGFPLTVHNRTRSKEDELVAAGAQSADSPKAVSQASDIVVSIVTDSPDVEAVVLGPDGIIEGARQGLVHIDMSTISPQVTQDVAARLAEKGAQMLDAPVSGGDVGAQAGTLSIMVGGPREAFDRCLPIFEAMGKNIVYCGESGMGQNTKLTNQIVAVGNILGMCEGLIFAAKAGLDLPTMQKAVVAGAAGSWMMNNLAPRIFKGNFTPGFMIRLQQKDLRLALEAAEAMDLPLPGTSMIHQLFRSAQAAGDGDAGTQAVVKVLERMGDVECRSGD